MRRSLELFLKGLCMGSADIIPGISGGTVALILGIYEELIFSIKSVDLRIFPYIFFGLFARKYRRESISLIKKIKFGFLIPLATGIGCAFLLLANVISFLLCEYRSLVYAFFLGLILSSGILLLMRIEGFRILHLIFIMGGIISASLFLGISTISLNHSLPVIFLSGVISVCAMILPGISGAFMMVFLGQYEYMLFALKSLYIPPIITYIVGAVIGVVSFSHFLSKLIKKYKSETLSFLIGLMLGGLRVPIQNIKFDEAPLPIMVCFVVGIVIVTLVEYFGRKSEWTRS